MLRRLLHPPVALLLAARAGAGARDRARAGRRRAGAAGRRGRARDPHAHQAGLARLLAEPRRRRAADGRASGSCRRAFPSGRLRYPVPTRLTVAGPDELCLRARLCGAGAAQGASGRAAARCPIRADAHWLACTDKICVPEQGELSLDLPVGSGTPNRAQFDAWRRALPQPLGDRRRISRSAATSCASRSRSRRASRSASPICSRSPTRSSIMRRRRRSARRRQAGRRACRRRRRAAAIRGRARARRTGAGSSFARCRGRCPKAERRSAASAGKAVLWAVLGAIAGGILLNLMPCVFPILALKALHLSRAGGDAREARARCARLCRRRGRRHRRARRGAARDPRRGSRGGLGVPAAGPAHDHAAAAAGGRRSPPTCSACSSCRCSAAAARPAGSFGDAARWPRSSRRPAPGRSSAPRSGPRCCCRRRDRCWCSPRSGSASPCRSWSSLSFRRFADRLPKPGPWMDRLQRFLAIPMAASAVAALWLLYRQAGEPAC